MAAIIRGTTPTIEYTYKVIKVADIISAFLTIKQGGVIIVKKNLADATVGEKSLSWTLTQEDTLKLRCGSCGVMNNWLLATDTRGGSLITTLEVKENHINEVIT